MSNACSIVARTALFSTTRRSAAALSLSALVTLGILSGINGLASQPAADALLANQVRPSLVVGNLDKPAVKS